MSVRPWNLSGSGSNDFVNISNSFTYTDSSPLSVRLIVPRAPMISPISVSCFRFAKASGKRSPMHAWIRFLSRKSWILPVSSCSVKNASFPNTRRAIMRPAIATSVSSISSPFGKSAYFDWRSAILWLDVQL